MHRMKFVIFVPLAVFTQPAFGQNLLTNGDFEAAPILGNGQSGVSLGNTKSITTDPSVPSYQNSISGISSWIYATPLLNGAGSDHGIARRNASFGGASNGQSAFINNWNRMMSQTVTTSVKAGDRVQASVDVGTLGSDTDGGRAGQFYLVAGEASALDKDTFSPRSIILAQLNVANPTWTQFVSNVVVPNRQYVSLNLTYTYLLNDPALGLPLTLAFRTVTSSVGSTYWDNASLSLQRPAAVPEPGTLALLMSVSVSGMGMLMRRRRK